MSEIFDEKNYTSNKKDKKRSSKYHIVDFGCSIFDLAVFFCN